MTDADLTNLRTRRTAVMAELAAMSSTTAGGKPNSLGGHGESVDHAGYKKGLYEELEKLNELISSSQCWEIRS